MSIPRNWSEELVSERLYLEGYSTEVSIKVSTGDWGDRTPGVTPNPRLKRVM